MPSPLSLAVLSENRHPLRIHPHSVAEQIIKDIGINDDHGQDRRRQRQRVQPRPQAHRLRPAVRAGRAQRSGHPS